MRDVKDFVCKVLDGEESWEIWSEMMEGGTGGKRKKAIHSIFLLVA